LGGAEGKVPIDLEQTQFAFEHFATGMRLPNPREFNKWKKVRVAGLLEK